MSQAAHPDEHAAELARQRQAQLLKPAGALGRLEDLACWFAARQGRVIPDDVRAGISVFAADHGVAGQGVSAYPSSVTLAMLHSLTQGQAAIAVLANKLNADLSIIDVGVCRPADQPLPGKVLAQSIAMSTADLSQGPAMSAEQLRKALQIGAEQVEHHHARGNNLLIAGEVGIGNTTSAAALVSAATGWPAEATVGRGTGIDDARLAHKRAVVQRALARVSGVTDAQQLLQELGGFEIAAMSGFYLQAARRGIPVLLDGYISTAAALMATRMDAGCRDWLLATHQSAEPGHALALQHLQLSPLLALDMRLGEGSGAAIAVPLIQQALWLHRHMATFAEANVSQAVS